MLLKDTFYLFLITNFALIRGNPQPTSKAVLPPPVSKVPTTLDCCKKNDVPVGCLGLCSPVKPMKMISTGERHKECSQYENIIEACFQPDVTNSSNRSCQDYSPHCVTILAKSCKMPLQADVCKSTCGLCNDNQLPLPSQPRPPLPLKDAAAIACRNFGDRWNVAKVVDRALVCTKDGVSARANCYPCSSWRLMVWENGGFENNIHEMSFIKCPNRSTIAGKYYGGHPYPCNNGVKDNYPLCGEWA